MPTEIAIQVLSSEAFAPFGDVIEIRGAESISINEGFATRYNDLAGVDVTAQAGRPLINIFRGRPRPLPITIHMLERHPLASQAFIPLQQKKFLVVVAPPGDMVDPTDIRAFISDGSQGVNYARGVWHFPLLVLGNEQDFLVVDRGGEGDNFDEHYFDQAEACTLKM